MAMNLQEKAVYILTAVGALNWGAAAFNYNLVEKFLPAYATYVYYAVGAAGAYALWLLFSGELK